jgi:16S rRNA (guanine527-N7)-methyltransferase
VFHVKPSDGARSAVSRETQERLAAYVELLLRWNRKINLISRGDEAGAWARHIEDALQLVPFIPPGADRAIDLGSGGGLPGIVLAIATRLPFDLVESDRRKGAFLREAARATGAEVMVHTCRIEDAVVAPAPLVTARALAPLAPLLGLAHRFVAPGGVALFPKGAAVDQELTDARAAWNMRVERFPSRTHPDGAILRLSEVTRA